MSDPTQPWRPKAAPDLRTDFYKSRRPEFQPDSGRGPVSQKQIEDMKAARQTPLPPAPRLSPPGMSIPLRNDEERVRFMQNRLERTKDVVKDRFQRVSRGIER